MASLKKNKFGSDDEDDLESLRLAALKSLKPKASAVVALKPLDFNHGRSQNMYKQHPTFGAAQTTRNHNRGFRNNGGRIGRNGINPRIRGNPNLISIQVIDENDSKEPTLDTVVRPAPHTEAPKLILPQDRYHKTQTAEVSKEKESLTNKFDRYKNSSDESDSDSDEHNLVPAKRERKNSLEALIDDIDNILEDKDDYKTTDEKKSESDDDKIDTLTINSQTSNENDNNLKQNDSQKEANDTLIIEDMDPDIVQIIQNEEKKSSSPRKEESNVDKMPLNRSRSRSPPYLEKSYNSTKAKSRSRSRSVKSRSKSPYNKAKSPYRSPRRSRSRSPIRKRYSPLPYSRPLSTLTLNTDVLNTIAMAPLSPRSAAFVLENRQILARRQMSPRRSRSPMRRSPSPKRMKLSPRRRTRSRSRSPRFDPVRKCSLSPRKRSNSPKFSPKRRSTSPRNYSRRSPNLNRYKNRNSNSPVVKQSVHKRLGTKNSSPHESRKPDVVTKRKRTSRSISLSLSPSPDRNYHKRPLNETTGQLNENKINRKETSSATQKSVKENKEDPILLARRKKFESPVELGKNNGVIKLNTYKSKQTEIVNKETTTEELSDAQLDDTPKNECFNAGSDIEIELNTNIDDLWSDEESDSENEGRFKSKTSNKNIVPTISIRNLTEKPIPKESLLPRDRLENSIAFRTYSDREKSTRQENIMPSRAYSDRDKSTTSKRSKYDGRRSKSSKSEPLKNSSHEKGSKDRISSKSKIRYEPRDKSGKTDNAEKNKETNDEIESKEVLKCEDKQSNSRRVKINAEPEVVLERNSQTTDEPEIIIENDDDVVPKDDESDLRAEICRRRAERLQKAGSIAGALPTRLLKSALQEVVPKRSTSKPSNISKGSVNVADRKVLIIKSLASSPVTKIEPANKVVKSKKEIGGKLPIHMRLGQSNVNVNVNESGTEDGGVRERRPKKSRTGKRKNRKVVQVPYNWFSICNLNLIFLLSIFTMALALHVLSKCADIFQISKALNTASAGVQTYLLSCITVAFCVNVY